jgi:Rrf2 family transcriptional regulator, nitric oxide-sensitive transcriptional repressor
MRLTRYTDYAMRVLLYLGAQPDRICSIGETP